MRPERAVVKKAIQDAGGNLSRSAALLGCTRQTLYTWIYQLGLERMAGVRPSRIDELDKRSRMDTSRARSRESGETSIPHVQSAGEIRPILRVVETQEVNELTVTATVKLPESLWKRTKIQAIEEGTTIAAIVARGLRQVLAPQVQKKARSEQQ